MILAYASYTPEIGLQCVDRQLNCKRISPVLATLRSSATQAVLSLLRAQLDSNARRKKTPQDLARSPSP